MCYSLEHIYLFLLGLLNNVFDRAVYMASKLGEDQKISWNGCERKQLWPHSHTAPTLCAETEENHKPQSTGLDPRLKFETRAL